jgi:hypothetical protein
MSLKKSRTAWLERLDSFAPKDNNQYAEQVNPVKWPNSKTGGNPAE